MRKAQKFIPQTMGPRQVRVRCSDGAIDRAGEVVVQSGIQFAQTVPVLWQHNPNVPVGRATPSLSGDGLYADVEFAPQGVSAKADEICGLVKSGTIDTVSIGFDPIDAEPMDTKRPRGPQKYLQSELLELSFVSAPANPNAEVVARSIQTGRDARIADLRILEERGRRIDEIVALQNPRWKRQQDLKRLAVSRK